MPNKPRFEFIPRYPDLQDAPIRILGEAHTDPACMEGKLQLIHDSYQAGMRHLFMEISYCTALELNRWIKAADDEILDELLTEFRGTNFSSDTNRRFLKTVKDTCPEIIIHGFDIEMDKSFAEKVLERLRKEGLEDTRVYKDAEPGMTLGESWTSRKNSPYDSMRDLFMSNLFRFEFKKLGGEGWKPFVLAITGSFHCADIPYDNLVKIMREFDNAIPFQVYDMIDTDTGGIVNRLPIPSVKKQFAYHAGKDCKQVRVDEPFFKGTACLVKPSDMTDLKYIPLGRSRVYIADDRYSLIEAYPDHGKYAFTTLYDYTGRLAFWYFDFARSAGMENGIPFIEDLFLDLVVTPGREAHKQNHDTLVLAYCCGVISGDEAQAAYDCMQELKAKHRQSVDELVHLSDYLKQKLC